MSKNATSELIIDTTPKPISFGLTGDQELEQNIRLIVSTFSYSVRFDVNFASTGSYIDSPSPADTARLIAELSSAIEKQEARVKVKSIKFKNEPSDASQGRVYPIITLLKKEEA